MTLIVIAGDDKYASAVLTHSFIVASADHGACPLQNERPNQQNCLVPKLCVGVMVSLPPTFKLVQSGHLLSHTLVNKYHVALLCFFSLTNS